MDTALATPEWKSFTQRYWGLDPVELTFAPRGPNGPRLRALFYADRKGRLQLPAYQPHLPLQFTSTSTDAPYRLERQWLETARALVDEMTTRGIRGEVTFPPETVSDLRPWKWGHFRVTPRFTNYVDFPFTLGRADRVVRQQAAKAERAGYACERTDDPARVLECLAGSQSRKRFAYGMSLEGLALGREMLGPDVLRLYLCSSPQGRPATARVIIHRPGGRALDWMAGTAGDHLHSGATQMLLAYALDDLQAAGATGYNSCGADIEPVAYTKLLWGGRLVVQYSVQAYDYFPMRKLAAGFVRYHLRRRALRRGAAHPGASPGKAPQQPPPEGGVPRSLETDPPG